MGDLWRRLERIEKRQRDDGRRNGCAECGEGVPGHTREYRVVFGGEPIDGPERCPACGRQLVYSITFDEEG